MLHLYTSCLLYISFIYCYLEHVLLTFITYATLYSCMYHFVFRKKVCILLVIIYQKILDVIYKGLNCFI